MRFVEVLSRTVRLMDLPFGYTLSTWSAGAIASGHFGPPTTPIVFVFIGGSVAAYLVCAAFAFRELTEPLVLRVRAVAVFNVVSIVAAGAVSLVSQQATDPVLGYGVAGFTATFTYVMCMSLLLYLTDKFKWP